jgi:outer membrane lipoprotein-sorting protein
MMNCNEFNKRLTELFDKEPDTKLVSAMHEHMACCSSCAAEYNQTKQLLNKLKPDISLRLSDSGFKQKSNHKIKTEEIEMETIKKETFKIKKWHKQAMAIAASILFIVTMFMVSDRTPFVSTARAAESVMAKSISAMESLRSMYISMNVRSLKKENFDFIGTEYNFIEYKYWKQFSGNKPWRVEKPGRIVVFDGEKQFLYLPDISYAITASEQAGFVEWMKLFLEPKDILESELRFSEKHKAKYQVEKTDHEIVLTIKANALGDFHNNYMKNNSILESDNSRKYVFDKKTSLLKSFELFIHTNGQSYKVIEIQNIAYNIPIPATTFTIELPQGVKWQELSNPGYIKAFTKITSKQAAKKFFMALAKEDYEAIKPVWDALQITDPGIQEEIRSLYGGLELISLGKPFKSGLFPGEFVPYKIKLKSGEIKEYNLAIRNDNPTKTWEIDGGI